MKCLRKLLVISLIIMFFTSTYMPGIIFATPEVPQAPPSAMRISSTQVGEEAIGKNEYDGNYIDLAWNVSFPPGDTGYTNLYMQEINKPYQVAKERQLVRENIPASTTNIRINNLKSGTIYIADATAYYSHTEGDILYNSNESPPSNKIHVMTNIQVEAQAYGQNQIKIIWDDVWAMGRRINYRLYISETNNFSITPPLYINSSQIGTGKPVTVNEATGKLEYNHTVAGSGKVYYIKVVPDNIEQGLFFSNNTAYATVSSYILVRTNKISTTSTSTIWKLEWSPVTAGLGGTGAVVKYQLYRGSTVDNGLPEFLAEVDSTNFFVTLPIGNVSTYFIIRASVKIGSQDVYEGIRIESQQVFVGEQEASSTPEVPVLVDKFENSPNNVIISYNNELKPNSVTILWRIPLKGNGEIDKDVSYDIWLIKDTKDIDNPPDSLKIASDFKTTIVNYVKNENDDVLGCKYVISDLLPNSTYYLKMVAKKTFTETVDNILTSVVYTASPILKVINTPLDGRIDQPVAPARPPFRVKRDGSGNFMLASTSAVLQIKNLWYEKFDTQRGVWEYIKTEKNSIEDNDFIDPASISVDDVVYRKVQYDSDVVFNVGCIPYEEELSVSSLAANTNFYITGIPAIPNDELEIASLNPDGLRHNVDINLKNLEPNTTYIIWLRAVRSSTSVMSGISDPIVITTSPKQPVTIEKPIIPSFNYNYPLDKYIDLGWDINPNYNYNIKYGTEDDINKANGFETVSKEYLESNSYYRVGGLTEETLYYFWIQAVCINENETTMSEWSNSLPVKTMPKLPLAAPFGFGVKNSDDAITESSIIFEWQKADEIEYILEISENAAFSNSKIMEVSSVEEYMVEELKSNTKYYARLYAYDPETDTKSSSTASIIVKTMKNNDEYDSNVDNITEEDISDFLDKAAKVINKEWSVSITGNNVDKFIEYIQRNNTLMYKIDLSSPPSKADIINITISSRIFRSLNMLKSTITINTGVFEMVLRPEVISVASFTGFDTGTREPDIKIIINNNMTWKNNDKNLKIKSPIIDIKFGVDSSGGIIYLNDLDNPIEIVYPYTQADFYNRGKTAGFMYDELRVLWEKLNTRAEYDQDSKKGNIYFKILRPGSVVIGEPKEIIFDFYNITIGEAVKAVFDALGYEYDNTYMKKAAAGKLISEADVENYEADLSMEKALSMLARVYELKTGIEYSGNAVDYFINNGVDIYDISGYLDAYASWVIKAEFMELLEKVLSSS